MTLHEPDLARLARMLGADYAAAPRGEKMTALHLFGIVHAEALAAMTGAELDAVASAAGSASFSIELRKMIKLARHVTPKAENGRDEPLSALFARIARPLPADLHFDRDEANAR